MYAYLTWKEENCLCNKNCLITNKKENCFVIKKKSNLEKQLIDIRKNYHQNYVKLNSNACEATATDHKNNLKPSARDNQTNQIKTNSGKSSNKFNVVV